MKKSLLLTVCFLGIQLSQAQTTQQRIRQGVASGEITKKEMQKIKQQKQDVKNEVNQAKADGIVTGHERKEINQEKKELSKTIYRKKHNAAKR
jgi:multidrug resistance efflux pump